MLYSFKKYLENTLSWYGVYWEETRLYSMKCSLCGSKMMLVEKTRRKRVKELWSVLSADLKKIETPYLYTGH